MFATSASTIGYSTSTFTPGLGATTAFAPLLTTTNFYTASAGLTYAVTPFISAGLNAAYTERVDNHAITPESLILASLSYRPY